MNAVKLNNAEFKVYEACKTAARCEGDNGYEFTLDSVYAIFLKDTKSDIKTARKVLRGYLGQLTQKGMLEKYDDCYFDFGVRELTPEGWLRLSCFEYEFDIQISAE